MPAIRGPHHPWILSTIDHTTGWTVYAMYLFDYYFCVLKSGHAYPFRISVKPPNIEPIDLGEKRELIDSKIAIAKYFREQVKPNLFINYTKNINNHHD